MVDLSSLNREQLQAVLVTEGPLLVLAGAGSGKTRVITYRLAHLVAGGVSPKNILCVTFTNKAAAEMKERAKSLVGRSLRGTTISTFHALGARILRAHPDPVGLRSGFTITDGAEQLGTVRRLLRSLRIEDKRFDAKRIITQISHAKNAGIDAAGFRALEGVLPHLPEVAQEKEDYQLAAIEVYERYESALKTQNIVDFDDLLLLPLKLLDVAPDVRRALNERWTYLMVDEYQDTNGAQLALLNRLAGDRKNLCVVGDDDQSIYGWRGADVRNILGFERHFSGAGRIMLLTNYRSTGHILNVANAIIEHNPNRYDKRLVAASHQGEPVRVSAMDDEEVEAEEVAKSLLTLTASGVAAGDIAVLFRSNVQARPLELALRAVHVPYRVVGGLDLFDRKEVKDALAYLRVLHNPDEEQSLRRILNWPPRGIGDTTVAKVEAWAQAQDCGLFEAFCHIDEVEGLSARAIDAGLGLVSLLRDHQALLARRKASTVVKRLIEAAGIEANLFDSSEAATSAERRVENVRAIVRQLERYESRSRGAMDVDDLEGGEDEEDDLLAEAETGSLEGFLGDLALSGFEDTRGQDEYQNRVVLSTIHAAKGLEWPHVFLIGWEEELLPHRRTMQGDPSEFAEERRLAYVAVTRAKAHLHISWARKRTRFGQLVDRKPSRFLEGLPEESVERLDGALKPPKTEEEEKAVAKDWMAKIRADLEARQQKG